MSSQRSANAVGGKTARACDSCLRRRARWYCAADDAFLCQACDSSIHSANPLARRHDRVRLKTSSSASSLFSPSSDLNSALPAWHQGFKRKARTPRHAKASASMLIHKPAPLVPDLENINANNNIEGEDVDDEEEEEEEKEQLLYRVPIFDPVLSEFCSPPALDDANPSTVEEVKPAVNLQLLPAENQNHGFAGFNPSEMELEEFAADVENLLGQGMDVDDSFCIDGLGLLEAREDIDRNQVKMELMDTINNNSNSNANLIVDAETEFSRESLDFNFDCCRSPAIGEEADVEQKVEDCYGPIRNYKVGLRLDYEAVIAAWSTSSCRDCSPWTDGERPQFNLDDCWPDFTGMWGVGEVQRGGYGEGGLGGGQMGNGDRGREARVSRYREKRRTRLFSKKIRYEVRKLNAEKRPRMKGRFVKRASFPPTAAAAAVVAAGPAAAAFPYV